MSRTNPNLSNSANTTVTDAPHWNIGFTVMIVIIVFVAYWMNSQGLSSQSTGPVISSLDRLPGFSSEAWLLPEDDLLGFVEVPAGEFIMGSNPALDRLAYENERWSNLQRQGNVELPSFYISRYETTISQFRVFAEEASIRIDLDALEGGPTMPVSNITWSQAVAYTQWLDEKMRNSSLTPDPLMQLLKSGAKIRLPSEAEWEKAARSSDGRVFPWGSQPTSEFSNFDSEKKRSVGAVACANCAHNLSDMAGNVWEMTRSPMQDYPYDPGDDGADLAQDALWVMRGGSYSDAVNNVRAAVRGGVDPGVRNDAIGFRVVITFR